MTKVHPKDLGFRLGLTVSLRSDGGIEKVVCQSKAKAMRDVVYVAVRDDGAAIKVGQTGQTLWGRWSGALRVIDPRGRELPRPTERLAHAQWQQAIVGHGGFEVWFRPAASFELDYIPEFPHQASLRSTEEIYLDRYFEPLIGKSLEGRLA